ncbi:hypothetical protein EVAR_74665_1 [Eumeta japonica]|uniref:Uncharacterized protein n=1 Tax=Eumeta variegata TaxID=151549 RepID=A0A4C1WB86_EUMVA|nr:hypothetical protein EVAR_74665_1 [Eumeta japonica]
MVPEVEDRNPDKSAAIQPAVTLESTLSTKHPNLKMLDAIIPNTALFYKASSGAVLGRKSKLSRRNVPYTKCRTVIYASPVFTPLQKQYIDYSDSSSRDHIPMSLRVAVDYQPPHPTHLIRRPRNVLTDPPDALTAAVESLNDVNDTHD